MTNLESKSAFEISNSFVEIYKTSSRNPPQTVVGHINHENGIVNDYRGRAIYEFFQNAIDRAKNNIWIRLDTTQRQLIIANDGQPFSIQPVDGQPFSDFSAVCSINTSSKNQNESIGNKGVGFKSCWEYTDQVTVRSEHLNTPWGFKLNNPLSSAQLKASDIKDDIVRAWLEDSEHQKVVESKGKIPSFYFPQPILNLPLKPAGMESAVTIITFDNLKDDKLLDLAVKIREFGQHHIFFTTQLPKRDQLDVTLTLEIDKEPVASRSTQHKLDSWLIVPGSFKGEQLQALQKESQVLNYRVDNPKIAIAFPLKEELQESASASDTSNNELQPDLSRFYCYLPTQEAVGFNVLIHGDFLLDVSRKQIDFENNKYNQLLLEHAADLLTETLCKSEALHQLPFFAKFLSARGANAHFKRHMEQKLLPKLPDVLRKVYLRQRTWPLRSYQQVFEAIDSWQPEYIPYERDNKRIERYKTRINPFCGEGIYIVPISDDVQPLALTYLPEIKEGNTYTVSLFYRSGEKGVDKSLNLRLLQHIPKLAISASKLLDQNYFKSPPIVREFSTKELMRALVKADDCHREDVLRFCCQLVKADTPIVRDDFFTQDHEKQLTGNLLLPCIDGNWYRALQCYTDIPDDISVEFDATQFFQVDKEAFQSYCDTATVDPLLRCFGVWVGCLPLPVKQNGLPWKLSPPRSSRLKELVNNSIGEWSTLGGLETVRKALLTQAWFKNEVLPGVPLSPADVFLFNSHDTRKIPCIPQERQATGLGALYEYLAIHPIEETNDVQKIIRQLQRMRTLGFVRSEYHSETYKSLIKRLAQLWTPETALAINLNELPLLERTPDGEFNYCADGDALCFAPPDQKRYKLHFRDKRFVHFDDDTPQAFVRACGIKFLAPKFKIEYRNEQEEVFQPTADTTFKSTFELSDYLPSLFAIAESVLGSTFRKDDAIARWQRMEVRYAHNAVLSIDDEIVDSTKAIDTDVLYIPISDHRRNADKTLIGVIAHDLQNPFFSSSLSKFGPVLADAVFRNIGLGDVFSTYLTKCYLSNFPRGENDRKARNDFLNLHGLSDSEIVSMQAYISTRLLTDAEITILLQALQAKVSGSTLTRDNFREPQHYQQLATTVDGLISELGLDTRFTPLLVQLDPTWDNIRVFKDAWPRMQLRIDYCRKYRSFIQAPASAEKMAAENKPLLSHFNFSMQQLNDRYHIPSDITDDALHLLQILQEHGLGDELQSPSATLTVLPHSPGGPQGAPHVGTVHPENNALKEEGQRKRGIGTEKYLCYQFASEFVAHNLEQLDALIQRMIEVTEAEDIEPAAKAGYLKELRGQDRTIISTKDLAALLQVSATIGDGLGYDIFYPQLDTSPITILKVEVKSGGHGIYLSENERRRVLYFAERHDDTWRLWVNSKEDDRTQAVIDAVQDHHKVITANGGSLLFAETWYLNFQEIRRISN